MGIKFVNPQAEAEFNKRLKRTEIAIALGTPDTIPVIPFTASVVQRLFGSDYRDLFYSFKKAGDAALRFFEVYKPDAHMFSRFSSGKANELAGSDMMDWPGRPGSTLSFLSSHQAFEKEYLLPEEYPEFLDDFSGFMLKKYIPRAFPNLKGLASIRFAPSIVLGTSLLDPLFSPEALEAYSILAKIKEADLEAASATSYYKNKIEQSGIPPFMTTNTQAPYDILGDYFRSTMGMFEDLIEREDYIEKACWMLADQQIERLRSFDFSQSPVWRVHFPLHKGIDGFMSPSQYEHLYWKPLKKIILALIDMDVTPIIYTEGRYDSRLEQLTDVPAGKVIYHFENVDMAAAKRIVGKVACICGNLPHYLLEFGTKGEVVDYCKYLIDTCAPGGGYIFDTDACLENAKRENLDAMFETMQLYGTY
jgi:hypothetical protein